ncbi:MAG: hypothetical protein V3T53_06160 [Phycisphaerales bacterium]
MSLVEATKKVLGKKRMAVDEIAKAVKKIGYRTKSANFRNIANHTLV